jgi:RNA polymerase sigma factor (TIGR02999 family)
LPQDREPEDVPSDPSGGKAALDAATPAIYRELKRLARNYLARERTGHTLQPTALVHEAYMRLVGQRSVDWTNHAQFIGVAANMMRRILTDHAKARMAAKRGKPAGPLALESTVAVTSGNSVDVLDLDRALTKLSELDQRLVSIVELRFYGGLSIEETAEALHIGVATVSRDWATARLWLMRELNT